MGMVADDGVGTGVGEGCSSEALAHGGRLLELGSPMEDGDGVMVGVGGLVVVDDGGKCLGAQLADVGQGVGGHPVLEGEGDAVEEGDGDACPPDEDGLDARGCRRAVAEGCDAGIAQGTGGGAEPATGLVVGVVVGHAGVGDARLSQSGGIARGGVEDVLFADGRQGVGQGALEVDDDGIGPCEVVGHALEEVGHALAFGYRVHAAVEQHIAREEEGQAFLFS